MPKHQLATFVQAVQRLLVDHVGFTLDPDIDESKEVVEVYLIFQTTRGDRKGDPSSRPMAQRREIVVVKLTVHHLTLEEDSTRPP